MKIKGKHNGLYYEIKGKGESIIFLHGIGGTHNMFSPQIEVFSEVAQTIAIDLKGHGQSESVNTTRYLDVHCRSLLDLMEHLELEEAIFVGLSYGGIVTQAFAIRYPEKVKQMILIDTYAAVFPRTLSQIPLTMFGLFIASSVLLPYKMLTPLFKKYEQWELAHQTMIYNYKTRKKFQMALQLIEVGGKNYLKDLQKLPIPTLVIVGDVYSSVVEKSFEIYESLPNAEMVIVKKAMDPTNLCAPDEVNEALISFIQPGLQNINFADKPLTSVL